METILFYRCRDCRKDCDFPIERSEIVTSEAWGQVAAHEETFNTCPHCNSEAVDEVFECEDCHGDGGHDGIGGFCDSCGGDGFYVV